MLASAVAGGLAGAFVKTPPLIELARHLVEGTLTYLDVMLLFVTATIFIAIIAESGGVNYLVRGIIRLFYKQRIIALLLLMILILIPGALTGAGSVSILTVGAPSALALGYLGISKKRVAAILFIIAGLSAAAPPINIWAMIVCAGTAIPYVGFELTLGIPVLLLGTFTMLFLGWKKVPCRAEFSPCRKCPGNARGECCCPFWFSSDWSLLPASGHFPHPSWDCRCNTRLLRWLPFWSAPKESTSGAIRMR
jgi:CitMHS family citrate-Mg2+:H+ or citrate-Ca2+:H+ symporter